MPQGALLLLTTSVYWKACAAQRCHRCARTPDVVRKRRHTTLTTARRPACAHGQHTTRARCAGAQWQRDRREGAVRGHKWGGHRCLCGLCGKHHTQCEARAQHSKERQGTAGRVRVAVLAERCRATAAAASAHPARASAATWWAWCRSRCRTGRGSARAPTGRQACALVSYGSGAHGTGHRRAMQSAVHGQDMAPRDSRGLAPASAQIRTSGASLTQGAQAHMHARPRVAPAAP